MAEMEELGGEEGLAVAIIGMAVRFPGAPDVESFWRNLRGGVESITFFSDEQLRALGVEPAAIHSPNYVKAAPIIEGIGRFDAAFFGYSPREAELLDPQHRLFLECAWRALEHAGQAPSRHKGATGIFAGSSLSSYLLFNLATRAEISEAEDSFPFMVANDKDFLATRVAYHLDCRGPALTVQTGCSTSLVAVHLACQALLGYQCDLALAGGVSVHVPQRSGYHYQEGGITSPDGHCRAFDVRGQGTLFGSGVGAVVLKRLEDALADGDTVHAIIRGSAINNDGALKVGYTAPGVEGQAEVVTRAQAMAQVPPETITYVEAHGTATQLGDPVEVEALTRAFRAGTDARNFCAIGSVKTNIGHLDAAAGVAGLVKTVLALEHGELPPTLNFEKPNPRIDFDDSPLYVNTTLSPWPRGSTPRRAGVSSFGIGGTNAHVILEEAPPTAAGSPPRPWQLLPLSARTPSALEAQTAELLAHLKAHPEQELADVAYTLQVGRTPLEHRRAVVCTDRASALAALESRDPQRVLSASRGSASPSVVFMFPGGGAQYAQMARGLYESEATFRQAVDRCCELLRPRLGFDLRPWILPEPARLEEAQQRMRRTSTALPALFTVEYALAQLWQSWGVRPEAVIGHSLGEYAAACLAGVFSLEDALALVVLRGRLFEELPGGGMLSVPLPEEELQPLLGDRLSIAAINGPSQCAVAGTLEDIEALAAELTRREVEFRQVQIDVAAHSRLVEPILERFQAFASTLKLGAPSLPLVSNVTGTWMTPEQATDPSYWARHLRQTVRFGEGVRTLLAQPGRVLLEVGPGRTLGTLARLQATGKQAVPVLLSVRHPQDPADDRDVLCTALGRLWLAGVEVDWAAVHAGERRRRVPLPTYPFEGGEYWLSPEPRSGRRRGTARKSPDVASWFYLPSWQRAPLPPTLPAPTPPCTWLVFLDEGGRGDTLCEQLVRLGHEVMGVRRGTSFAAEEDRFTVAPGEREHCQALLRELKSRGRKVERIVHLWGLDTVEESDEATRFQRTQEQGLYSVVALAQALNEEDAEAVELVVVGREAVEVESVDALTPERAPLLAACKVIPQEHPQLRCRYVDLRAAGAGPLVEELLSGSREPVVAWRGRHRHAQTYQPLRLEGDAPAIRPLKERGVYLIIGGLGGVGLLLAGYLARTYRARLVLLGRSGMDDARRPAVQALEAAGAEVLVLRADVADEAQMRGALEEAQARFGALDGVIHAAGLAGQRAVGLVASLDPATCEQHFRAKVYGVQVLERVLRGRSPDFCLLVSSNASVLGGPGLAAYAAANGYMDAFASGRDGATRWLSATWDGWPAEEAEGQGRALQRTIDAFAMTATESVEAFRRVVEGGLSGLVVVSTGNLEARLAQWVRREGADDPGARGEATTHARPTLSTEFVPPSNALEETVARVWQEALGLDQLGIHDNFFDLGGSSLIWLKVAGRLKKELGRDVPLTSVFEAPTVAALAKKLGEGGGPEPEVYESSHSRGERRRERRNRRG